MKRIMFLLLTLLFLPTLAMGKTYQVKPDLKVILSDVEAPWSVSTEPIPELVDHLTDHILEEASEQGKTPTREQARQVALEQARHNQLFVLNKDSGAHLLISFSPLEKGESAPSANTVARSAKYAADGVSGEGWTDVSSRQAVTAIKGAQAAEWFTIEYTQGEERSLFMGIVGFAHPYWFWFYGTDHLKDPRDRTFLEKLMLSIEVHVDAK